jgi:hypothetical protein
MKKKDNPEVDFAKILYILSGLLFILGFCLLVWFGVNLLLRNKSSEFKDQNKQSVSTQKDAPCNYRRDFDGVCVQMKENQIERVVGVMVENSRDAWPLSGVASGSIVYEAPAESGIPRFLVLYNASANVPEVGPVRSSRPYYLDWLAEYGNPIYMHVGGSDAALGIIEDRDVFDMNEMHRGWYFWRSDDRSAPHNTYTSNQLWQKAIESYGKAYVPGVITPLSWLDTRKKCESNCFNSLTVSLSGSSIYDVTWKYSSTTDQLTRFQGGEEDRDKDGAVRLADTVIVQRVNAKVLDEIGRKQIDTIGRGEATIFTHGQVINASWRKIGIGSRTEWLDSSGNPVPIKSGKIWIEVVPIQGGSVNWD